MAKIGNLIIKKHENLGPSSDQVFWYLSPQNHMNKMEPDHPKLIKKWFDRLEKWCFFTKLNGFGVQKLFGPTGPTYGEVLVLVSTIFFCWENYGCSSPPNLLPSCYD